MRFRISKCPTNATFSPPGNFSGVSDACLSTKPMPGRVLESKLFIATLVDDGISMGDEPHMPLRINSHNNVVVERSARIDERGFLENQRKISGASGEIFIV